jgi:hypothetical protein
MSKLKQEFGTSSPTCNSKSFCSAPFEKRYVAIPPDVAMMAITAKTSNFARMTFLVSSFPRFQLDSDVDPWVSDVDLESPFLISAALNWDTELWDPSSLLLILESVIFDD